MRSRDAKLIRVRLRERDGDYCWYCGWRMAFDLPKKVKRTKFSATIEHLQDRSQGGGNRLTNLVLTHGQCNSTVNGRMFCEKIKLRNRKHRKRRKQIEHGFLPSFYSLFKELERESS